jgi:hypothetical protein
VASHVRSTPKSGHQKPLLAATGRRKIGNADSCARENIPERLSFYRLFLFDVLRPRFSAIPRASFVGAVFRPRALPSLLIDLMTASTAAWAAAFAAAVAALTAIFCTRAALAFAAPTIVRWVFRTKLFLAIVFSEKKARCALDHAAPKSIRMMMRPIGTPSSQRRIGMVNS